MRLGEVCLLTNDVVSLADFYRRLLGIERAEDAGDPIHQTIIGEETMLTVLNDGTQRSNRNQNICLAFTVDNMDEAYRRILELGAKIIEKPTVRPWGAVNMRFLDPDGNTVYVRQFVKEKTD